VAPRTTLPCIDPIRPRSSQPFHAAGWVYEEKYDGQGVRLVSRSGLDHTHRFPELAARVAALAVPTAILDGEVCAFGEDLVSRFHLLHPAAHEVASPPVFMVFDLAYVRGRDVRDRPLR
jgi:bifunctional non-homologous end joining protein LigD